MKFTSSILRTARILLAILGLAVLALPAAASHAAPLPAGTTTNFAARVMQGPDSGATLLGALQLTQLGDRLVGTLRVQPSDRPLTTRPVVPVVGEVLGAQGVALSFDLGRGRQFLVRLLPGAPVLERGLTGNPTAHWVAQTARPRAGDVAGIIIHIHIVWKGVVIDIEIEI